MLKLDAERLRLLLHYDPLTGIFTRRVRVSSRAQIGDQVGYDDGHGYMQVTIDGFGYQLNRLAWLYMTSKWPNGDVDHMDTVRNNNVWRNLRDVSHQVNTQNLRRPTCKNKTGYLGVVQKGNCFDANIKTDGKARYLGSFDSPEAAHKAYVTAKRQQHAGCTL